MTEQEAQEYAARLERVWHIQLSPHTATWALRDAIFYFDGHVTEEVCLSFYVDGGGPIVDLEP